MDMDQKNGLITHLVTVMLVSKIIGSSLGRVGFKIIGSSLGQLVMLVFKIIGSMLVSSRVLYSDTVLGNTRLWFVLVHHHVALTL